MKHPELLFLPLLMVSDYFLTLLGAKHKRKMYDRYFVTEHYELNPMWQTSVREQKWFNPKYFLLLFLLVGSLLVLIELAPFPPFLVSTTFGVLIVVFGAANGRHISNLLVFRYLNAYPDEIRGQITMSHSLVVAISLFQYMVLAIPLLLIALLWPSFFTVGTFIGGLALLIVHAVWLHRAKVRH